MIALVDGDVLCYQAIWKMETLDEAKDKLKEILQSTVESTFSDDYLLALGSETNFRAAFYSEYKKTPSRVASKSTLPSWFKELKEWFATDENAVVAHGCEADDLIRIWATEARNNNIEFIVCSIDKDLQCIPGKHFKPGKNEVFDITEDEADKHYWKQILMGDSVDNIPGVPGIGEVKALKILQACNNKNNRKAAVIEAYKQYYGESWKEYLLSNGRLIHIFRHANDYFKVPKED
jgi:5'-3' exonuclease